MAAATAFIHRYEAVADARRLGRAGVDLTSFTVRAEMAFHHVHRQRRQDRSTLFDQERDLLADLILMRMACK